MSIRAIRVIRVLFYLDEYYFFNPFNHIIYLFLWIKNGTNFLCHLNSFSSPQGEANEIIKSMSNTLRNKADIGIYTEDIKFSNLNPIADENIWINTTVYNFGTNGALFAQLQFLDNGVPISENITTGFIPSMDSIPVNITWNPTPGTHNITVRVNPDRRIQEYDYTNNEAFRTITAGSGPDNTPPQSITNLSLQAAGTAWFNFTWLNPPDPDYHRVMLYLNGSFKTSIPAPQNYCNFTGLDPDTLYELGTHTVDSSGNVNETWVNATARTVPSGAVPPVADCGADKLGCENVGGKVQFNGSAS